METTVLKLLDTSAVSSIVICIVLLTRLLLKKAPAFVRCLLWAIVGIRLLLPFGIESSLSLIPNSAPVSSYIENTAGQDTVIPDTEQGVSDIVDQTPVQPNPIAPNEPTEAQPLKPVAKLQWSEIVFWVWMTGALSMLCYAAGSYIWMYTRVKGAIVYDERTRIYSGDMMPFVLGAVSPKIYLPSHLNTEQINCIISHEKAHIKRCDHLIKPLAFLLLAAHWFNPLMWVAYILLCKDIELACDEKVIKEMNTVQRKLYSETLLLCSTKRFGSAVPLAFGEVGVKERIKKVMYYKKPSFWIIIVAVIAIAAVGVFFIANPKDKDSSDSSEDISTEQSTEQSAEAPSSEDESSTESVGTESEESVWNDESYDYSETPQNGVIGGYDNPLGTGGLVWLQFSGIRGFEEWLNGRSNVLMTDENGNEVPLHEHEPTENARKILQGRVFYSPTFDAKTEEPWEINVQYSLSEGSPIEIVDVSYGVKGYMESKDAYSLKFTYYEDKYTPTMNNGIVSFYERNGIIHSTSSEWRYTTVTMPIYDHMGYKYVETEVFVRDIGYRSFASFLFNNVEVTIFTRGSNFNVDDFKELGFIDMYYLMHKPIV